MKTSGSALRFSSAATLPFGFRAAGCTAGLKASGAPDMALFFSDSPANLAGVFTTNQVQAATVRLDQQRVKTLGMTHGIVINSGQANACTGTRGIQDARAMAAHAAAALGVDPSMFLVCSTGRIGIPLRMDLILPGIDHLVPALSPVGGESAARAIMTTDTRPKRFTVSFTVNGRPCRLTGVAKGAGMIEPCMGTMLAFLLTDVAVESRALQQALQDAVNRSFNRVSVDGDRSTNDTALLLANARAANTPLRPSHPDWPVFVEALRGVTLRLAKEMARDGEGASKFVTVTVRGARSSADADLAARAVANSMLVKTSWAGGAPNWGRVMDALGYSSARVIEHKIDIFYDSLQAVRGGLATSIPPTKLARVLARSEFALTIDLHLGRATATVYTCDCTEAYVRINMD